VRSFVAIPIDDAMRARISETQKALQRAEAEVRWVSAENHHLTLKFLGNLEEAESDRLRERLRQEAARFPPLDLDFSTVGRFPKGGPPRVLWIGCRGSDVAKLVGLAEAIERVALEIGVPREERPFSPHLTIGRVKSPRNQDRLLRAIEARRDDVFGQRRTEYFTLYRSTLTSAGPIYEEIERFLLGR